MASACRAFGEHTLDEPMPPADAAPPDGAPVARAAADADAEGERPIADASANLVPNGDFDGNDAGCGPGWSTQVGSADPTPIAHSGAYACRICAGAGPAYYGIHVSPRLAAASGTWVIDAYTRGAPDAGVPGTVEGVLSWQTPDASKPVSGSFVVDETGSWYRNHTTYVVPDGVTSIDVAILANGGAGTCFIVDDVVVTVSP